MFEADFNDAKYFEYFTDCKWSAIYTTVLHLLEI